MNPGHNEPYPIEETVFAQLLAGPLGNGVIPPGDYGPLDTSVYQSLAVANLFVRWSPLGVVMVFWQIAFCSVGCFEYANSR